MNRPSPVLTILASDSGVYQVGVRAGVDQYHQADRLSTALRPAIALINRAIRLVYSESETRKASGR